MPGIKGHAAFFDSLVELIPAKYYVPNERNESWMVGESNFWMPTCTGLLYLKVVESSISSLRPLWSEAIGNMMAMFNNEYIFGRILSHVAVSMTESVTRRTTEFAEI